MQLVGCAAPAQCPVYSECSAVVSLTALAHVGCCLLLSMAEFLPISNYYLEPWLQTEKGEEVDLIQVESSLLEVAC